MLSTLEIHYIKYRFKGNVKRLQLSAEAESSVLSMKKIYETRVIDLGASKGTELIHEKINFSLEAKECFVVLYIKFLEVNGQLEKWRKMSIHLFLEDFIKKDQKIVLNFDQGKISIFYTLNTAAISEIPAFERCDPKVRPEEIPNFIGQVKLLQEFIKKITALRRINTDVTDFIREKNIKRDCNIALGLIVVINYPIFFLLTCLIFLTIFKVRYKLRVFIVKKFMRYFEDYEDYMTEIQKNMHFIKLQQNMLIDVSDLLRKLFHDKNREMLFLIFRYIGAFIIALIFIIIFSFSLRLTFSLAILGWLGAKYNIEVMNYGEFLKQYISRTNFIDTIKLKASKLRNYIPKSKPEKLHKTCFTYENQRWYVGHGFTGKTFFCGKLNRKTRIF